MADEENTNNANEPEAATAPENQQPDEAENAAGENTQVK